MNKKSENIKRRVLLLLLLLVVVVVEEEGDKLVHFIACQVKSFQILFSWKVCLMGFFPFCVFLTNSKM